MICVVVYETFKVIVSRLLPVYISVTTSEQLDDIVKGLKEK